MSIKRRILALTMLAALLGTALCGCGGGSTGGELPTQPLTGEIVYGGEIAVGISQDLDESLDPHRAVAAGTKEVLFNVYEGLVKVTSDAELVPAVAESYVVSDDKTTYTFTLREGVLFHNGNAVTAEDVVYSLLRCAGSPEEPPLVAAFSVIRSVTALDAKTVEIVLSEPNNEFLAYLTCAIIPKEYDSMGTAQPPAGTGPFRYVSRSPQENVILERFDEYWGEGAFVERVTYKIFENADALLLALKGGSIQLCAHLTSAQAAELAPSFNILEGTMNLVQAVYLNNAAAPFDDENVRKAICHAIDRDQILAFTADGRGAKVGSSMYPAFTKYFNADLVDAYPHDIDKAKAYLAAAGYGEGELSFSITVPSNYQPHMDAAQVIAEQLRLAGINATVDPVDWNTWLEDTYIGRNFQSTVVGVDASSFTARAMLERFNGAADDNFINFQNAEYDAVYAKAIACTDEAEQIALYKELQAILSENAANVYIQDLCDLVATAPNLKGYEFYPIYVMDMSTVHYIK